MLPRVARVQSAALAPYRDVGNPAALARKGLFVAEGRLTVERLLDDRRFTVDSVAVTSSAADALRPVLARRGDVSVYVCDPPVLEAITGFNFHRGCLALAHRPAAMPPVGSFSNAARLLAVEGVGNPDNIGGLFRVALALGAGGGLLGRTGGRPLYRQGVRHAKGALLPL